MKFPYNRQVSSLEESIMLADEFSGYLKGDEVVVLNGHLGTGKTFFIREVLKNLGVKEEVSSPTFTLVNEYIGKFTIYHFDFYRINEARELIDIGYYDYFNNNALIFIEWGDLFPEMLPGKRIEINIDFLPEEKRILNTVEDFSRIFSIARYE